MSEKSEMPRRIDLNKYTKAERGIYDAITLVEAKGSHPLLTDAVRLLEMALGKVADHVDQIPPDKGEGVCERCRSANPVWFTAHDLWNKVAGHEIHFLCPTCFALEAERKGIVPTAWVLRPKMAIAVRGDIIEEIICKRDDQIKKGYTPEHDDQHTPMEFMQFEQKQILKAWLHKKNDYDSLRDRFLEIAAVAVAAIESIDRRKRRLNIQEPVGDRK